MRHVIAHDGIPVFALLLKSSGFSFKARYVNDVHLPRFGGGRGATRPTIGRLPRNAALYGTATRSLMHHGDSKDFSPSNSWNDSKTAVLRQLPQPAVAVLGLTREERLCRYTEWVSVGIPRRASRATGLGYVGIPTLTQSVDRPHPSR